MFRDNHKYNIYDFYHFKMKTIQFFSRIQKVEKKLIFLIKIIYKILCIIKKYIKFGNYFFSFFKKIQTQFFLLFNQKHQETYQIK